MLNINCPNEHKYLIVIYSTHHVINVLIIKSETLIDLNICSETLNVGKYISKYSAKYHI